MYNQPHQQLQHEQQHQLICQLCDNKIIHEDSYAGPFNRMCKQCYDQQIVDLQTPINFISDGIYIGSQKAARNQALLKQHKINAICVCGSQLKLHDYQDIKMQRKVLKILDTANQNISSCIPQVIDWIISMRNKNMNVLIHCAGGVSRSASICIAYFMTAHKLPYQNSYIHVKKGRKCIKPNQNFTKQLKMYEKQLNYK